MSTHCPIVMRNAVRRWCFRSVNTPCRRPFSWHNRRRFDTAVSTSTNNVVTPIRGGPIRSSSYDAHLTDPTGLRSPLVVRLYEACAQGDDELVLEECFELGLLESQGKSSSRLRLDLQDMMRKHQDKNLPDILVMLIQSGELLANSTLNKAIIRYFTAKQNFEKIAAYSDWFLAESRARSDDAPIDDTTYASIIFAHAKAGRSSEAVEELYSLALSTSNFNFRDYHFSSDAVVDPSSPSFPRTWQTGLELLAAIASARIITDQVTDAYKAMDIHFRLFPKLSPSRVLPEVVQHRPVSESFILHQTLTRDSRIIESNADTIYTRALLRRLWKSADSSEHQWRQRSRFNGNLLRSMLVILYRRGGLRLAGQQSLLGDVVLGFARSTEMLHAASSAEREPRVDRLYGLVRRIMKFGPADRLREMTAPLSNFIACAGKYGSSTALIATVLQDMAHHNIKPNIVTMKTLLQAAAASRDTTRVHSAWNHLVEYHEQAGEVPYLDDWKQLAWICAELHDVEFLWSALETSAHAVKPDVKEAVVVTVRRVKKMQRKHLKSDLAKPNLDAFDRLFTCLEADVQVLEEQEQRGRTASDGSMIQTAIGAHPAWQVLYDRTEADVRRLFYELTYGKIDVPMETAHHKELNELRFRRWDAMNHLFAVAESHHEHDVRENRNFLLRRVFDSPLAGLSDFIDDKGQRRPIPSQVDERQIPDWVKKARDPKEILRLRGRTLSTM